MVLDEVIERWEKVGSSKELINRFKTNNSDSEVRKIINDLIFQDTGINPGLLEVDESGIPKPSYMVDSYLNAYYQRKKQDAFKYIKKNLEPALSELDDEKIKLLLLETKPLPKKIRDKDYKNLAEIHNEFMKLKNILNSYRNPEDPNKEVYLRTMREKTIRDLAEKLKDDPYLFPFSLEAIGSNDFVVKYFGNIAESKLKELFSKFTKKDKLDKQALAKYIAMNVSKAEDSEKETFCTVLYNLTKA